MSRSVRKKPVKGLIATCRSEKKDKKLWHKRWRRRERITLACKSEEMLENHLTSTENEIIDVWSMDKDGRQRWPLHLQVISANEFANRRGRSPQERLALRKRFLHRWMGK